MQLRPYQQDAIERLASCVRAGKRRLILQAATGAGKTVMAAEIIRRANAKGKTVLFLAHRRELVNQAFDKLIQFGVSPGVIMAGELGNAWLPVQVASKDTLISRLKRGVKPPPADVIFIDEAHRTMGAGYQSIIQRYPNAVIIGPTATPCRQDGLGLGDIYEDMVCTVPVTQLIAEGHLVPARVFAPFSPDMTGVEVSKGDWTKRGAARVMDLPQLVGNAVTHWQQHAGGRQTIAFATRIEHSLHLCQRFVAAGVSAVHVDGEMSVEEREAALAKFQSGAAVVLTNVDVFTEGYDCPSVSCIVDCQPSKSIRRNLQKWGRGMRPSPGKTDLLILDHAGNILRHGFPDQDREWGLSCTERIEEREERAKAERKKPEPFLCPRCAAVFSAGRRCPNCDWFAAPKAVAAENEDGMLVEVTRKPTANRDEKAAYWRQCLAIAANTGRRCGAAAHMYRERYDVWPRGFEDMPKGDEWKMKAAARYPQYTRRRAA